MLRSETENTLCTLAPSIHIGFELRAGIYYLK